MKSFSLKPLFAALVCILMFVACDSFANTWTPPYQVWPHGGTGVDSHDRISPANATTAASVANGHGYFNAVQQATSASCIPQSVWTYYTYDVVFRPGNPVSYGYVHFWRQDC